MIFSFNITNQNLSYTALKYNTIQSLLNGGIIHSLYSSINNLVLITNRYFNNRIFCNCFIAIIATAISIIVTADFCNRH